MLEVLSMSVVEVNLAAGGPVHNLHHKKMAHQCRGGPARGQWGVHSTGPPAAKFTSTTDMDSSTSTESAANLGMVRFQTLDAQAYFSYDLDFARKPKEWTLRNMMSDCVLQGPDSSKRTLVEIFNYEHKLGGQTVRVFIFIQSSNFFYPGVYEIPLRAVQGSRREVDFCSTQSEIMFLRVPFSGFPAKLRS